LFLHFRLDNFIVTWQLSSIYRDCAKTNPTATLTATHIFVFITNDIDLET
jgi:hypothetical protein